MKCPVFSGLSSKEWVYILWVQNLVWEIYLLLLIICLKLTDTFPFIHFSLSFMLVKLLIIVKWCPVF